MNGSRVKKIRKEINGQAKGYAVSIQKIVSDNTLAALFLMPLLKRISFAVGLVFLPIWRK
jgi:hypothetical protein